MQKLKNIPLAVAFSKKWQNASNEKRESQKFLSDFLDIFGITLIPSEHFEYQVCKNAGERGYIDCLVKEKIAIEMKSKGEDLGKAFEQLKEYVQWLPENFIPKILMVCDFETIVLDFDKKKIEFKTKELRKHLDLFNCLLEKDGELHLQEQMEVNIRAAEKMAKLHDALKDCGYAGHHLEVYLVRLLFCLFAEDTGIFPKYSFLEYIEHTKKDGSDLSEKIARLFQILNTPDKDRGKKTNLPAELLDFQYINGGLFSDHLDIADFTEKMRNALIECAKFDWSYISPAVFGAMFQGVMNKEKRRELGAHYTSEENILKLINPLFMDSLREEFDSVKNSPKKLDGFHNKIASLKFLDPACGCGNFLIISYRELRKLELEVLKKKAGKSAQLSFDILWNLLRVNVGQFFGIEHEEFPCEIAKVGMWLIDHQMNLEASDLFGCYYARLPLTQSATIVHGNALMIDWESVVPKKELSFILGNPPFVGYSNQSEEQKADILSVYLDTKGKPFKTAGKIDYVAAWYYKAAKEIMDTQIRAAFVSTNSITQGEQVAAVWKPLFEMFSIRINFAYRTFKWSNEAKGKAAVHCVIVGFSSAKACRSAFAHLKRGENQHQKLAGGLQASRLGENNSGLHFLPRDKTIKPFSRELRNNSTKHENHLWYDFLCKFEPRFTRQRILGHYIADFFCYKAALVIELDGSQHYEKKAMEYDNRRTKYLNSLGIEVLRFPNREVDENFDGVCAKIAAIVKARCLQPPVDLDAHFSPLEGGLCANMDALFIYDGYEKIVAKNINPYLIDAPNIFIESRSKPLCNVPEMQKGNIPVDDGNLIIDEKDYDDFILREPKAEKFIRQLVGAEEFINNKKRYCLWLLDALPNELKQMPEVMKRVELCRKFRLDSKKEATRKFANFPTRFMEIRQPDVTYILIPRHSSEKRHYIPFGFMSKDVITTDANSIIANATLYHFGILMSSVHMAWVRAVCGRIKSDYRYSNDIVYNNFPWPNATDEQKAMIEKLAQNILDTRAKFPESSLADLYDPLTMPPELVRAHRELDRAVIKLYIFPMKDFTEAQCVASLMERHQKLVGEL